MGAVNNTLQLNDRMTPVLRSIMKALNATLAAMASVDKVATQQFKAASRAVQQANQQVTNFRNTINSTNTSSFNNSMNSAADATSGFISQLKQLIVTYGVWMGTQKLVTAGDAYTGSEAQLALMLKLNKSEKTSAEIQTEIYEASQRSLSNYREMSKTVGKLGLLANEAFHGNTDEMIMFSELLAKQFSLAKATPWEKSAATYQLTQAMASGRLQGDEFRSIIENAPMLAQTIQQYMGLTGQAFKEASKKGMITADVIKNALFSVAEETNEMFANLPLTFGELWTQIINKVDRGLEPVYRELRAIWNNPDIQSFIDTMTNGFVNLFSYVSYVVQFMAQAGLAIYDNWSMLAPPILAVVTAMTALTIATSIYTFATSAAAFATKLYKAYQMYATGATLAQTQAQWGLNAAMMANPIGLFILGIIALIGLLYGMVAVINKVAGTSLSATGVIVAMFFNAGAIIHNVFMGVIEFIFGIIKAFIQLLGTVANFFGNVFNDPIASVIHLFGNLAKTVLQILSGIASALDAIFGSDLSSTIQGWQKGLNSKVEEAAQKHGNGTYQTYLEPVDENLGQLTGWKRINYEDAALTGYDIGKGAVEKTKDMFRVGDKMFNIDNQNNKLAQIMADMNKNGKGILTNTGNTANALKNGIDLNEEDIELLKEYARVSFVNRFTTMTPNITATFGDVHENADVKGIMETLKMSVMDSLTSSLQ